MIVSRHGFGRKAGIREMKNQPKFGDEKGKK
jgi:hypothetical protein